MWLMSGFGCFMPALLPTKYIPEGTDYTLQIRSRRAKDLDMLRELYCPELGETIHTPMMDYNYRAYSTHDAFANAVAKMVLDINYIKFKETTETVYGDKDLHSVYERIWSATTALGTPYEGMKIGSYGRFENSPQPASSKLAWDYDWRGNQVSSFPATFDNEELEDMAREMISLKVPEGEYQYYFNRAELAALQSWLKHNRRRVNKIKKSVAYHV